jgi:predicted DNA-binding transcriptional regulator YafY
MLRAERPPEEHRAIDGARAKLRETIARLPDDSALSETHLAAIGANIDPSHLAAARAGLRGRRKLNIAYRRASAEEPQDRTVCPYALVASSGMFYLVAFCHRSDGLRIFRLDRIDDATVTEERFEIPNDFSLDRVLRDGRAFSGEGAQPMRIRYSARIARWIAEREGAPLDADGSLTLAHPVADIEWAVRHALQYGPEAEILGPPHVRRAVRDRLAGMAEITAD